MVVESPRRYAFDTLEDRALQHTSSACDDTVFAAEANAMFSHNVHRDARWRSHR